MNESDLRCVRKPTRLSLTHHVKNLAVEQNPAVEQLAKCVRRPKLQLVIICVGLSRKATAAILAVRRHGNAITAGAISGADTCGTVGLRRVARRFNIYFVIIVNKT